MLAALESGNEGLMLAESLDQKVRYSQRNARRPRSGGCRSSQWSGLCALWRLRSDYPSNRIAIRKLTYQECNEFAACDVLVAGPEIFVDDGQSPAALPAVAVAANGMVGVLYDTFEGMIGGLPTFVTHLAIADERHGPLTLMAFLSSAPDSGNSSRRVLGDFQQMVAVGNKILWRLLRQRSSFRTICRQH